MNHKLQIPGLGFSLRPVSIEDAQFIVEIRNADASRNQFLHSVSHDVQLQEDWLNTYFEREGDYYWVIQRNDNKEPEGLISIYDLNKDKKCAEWGRWIIKKGSMAAPESALLMYQAGFEILGLNLIYCITVADNKGVVSFHDSCGLKRAEVIKDKFQLPNGSFDGVRHECTREAYPALRSVLEPQVERIANRVNP